MKSFNLEVDSKDLEVLLTLVHSELCDYPSGAPRVLWDLLKKIEHLKLEADNEG